LVRLRVEDACRAVEGPLTGSKRSFAEGVAARLVGELLKTKAQSVTGETIEAVGEYVEPVQLQIVCQNLWDSLPPDVTVITSRHLQSFGDVDEALKGFYEDAVQKTISETDVKEEELRRWFDRELITPAGTRGTVYRGKEDTDGIPNAAVDILENEHILRGEHRAGAHWYELTHDRLIEPIQNSNEIWIEQARLRARKKLRRYLYVSVAGLLVLLSVTTIVSIIMNYEAKDARERAEKAIKALNLSLLAGAKASQSTTWHKLGAAERAIDGNTDGNWGHGSVTHTKDEANSWWQVRLPSPAMIEKIVIWNRSDACGDRLSNFRVSVLDDSSRLVWYQDFPGSVAQGGFKPFKPDAPVKGLFVKVQIRGTNKEGNGYLSLAEVQVFGELPITLQQKGAEASQSTTWHELGTAERAIDGNTDGNWRHGSVTHTKDEANSWWQVRLPSPAMIEKIVIWNRSDACGDRLSNFRVSVLDDSSRPVWQQYFAGPVKLGGSVSFEPDPSKDKEGLFVKVQILGKNKENTGYLSLAEVQVFGEFTK
ncbi:MAG: discoidin domain-containing protein, partial [Candidatus Hodarchaeota archaeon]